MYSSNLPTLSRKRISKDASMVIPSKRSRFYDSYFRQSFSLPSSIIYYITKNPSTANVYQKLIQSCKYFFIKNPILTINSVRKNYICSNVIFKCIRNKKKCCIQCDIKKVSSKIWLTGEIRFDTNTITNFISLLSPKFYRCEIDDLSLYSQNITFDDFKFLVASSKIVSLINVKIFYKDGSRVMFEQILEAIPNIEKFEYHFRDSSVITTSTIKNISKLKNLENLKLITLVDIPEILNVHDLDDFLKDKKQIGIDFSFVYNISQDYKNQLDALIDTVIKSRIRNRFIWYSGLDERRFLFMARNCDIV